MLVEAVPAVPRGERDVLGLEQLDDRVFRRVGGVEQCAVTHVFDDALDGLVGVALGVTDEADRATLDPPGCVQTGEVGAVVVDASCLIGDDAGLRVERDVGQVVRQVADGAVDRGDVPVGVLAGRLDVAGAVELGALGAQADDLAVLAEDLDRALEEVQEELVDRAFLGLTHRVVLDDRRDLVGDLGTATGDGRALVVVDVLGADDDLDVGRVVELLELERRELRLCRTAASEHMDLDGLVGLEALVDVGRDLGGEQFVAGLCQHARDVECDVADADDGDLLLLERPLAREVGVSVVPGDELCRAVAAVEVDAGDVECAVVGGAGREDHGVVVRLELVERDVGAVVDVAEQADLRLVEDLVQCGDDALDTRVVGGDAVPDQAERSGHPLVEIDADTAIFGGVGLHQGIGGVDAGRASSDDGDPQRAALISHRVSSTSCSGVSRRARYVAGVRWSVDAYPLYGRRWAPLTKIICEGYLSSLANSSGAYLPLRRWAQPPCWRPTGPSEPSAPTSRFRPADRDRRFGPASRTPGGSTSDRP